MKSKYYNVPGCKVSMTALRAIRGAPPETSEMNPSLSVLTELIIRHKLVVVLTKWQTIRLSTSHI